MTIMAITMPVSAPPLRVGTDGGTSGGGGAGEGDGGDGGGGDELGDSGEGDGGDGLGGGGEGDGGDGEGASRVTWTSTSMTDGAAGGSSMVTPNTLLISSRALVCKITAADSTWLAPPEVSVAITVRITLPALTVMVSSHAGNEHCSARLP